MKRESIMVLLAMAIGGFSVGDSAILTPNRGQTANDILTDYSFGGYDVVGDQVVGWANGSLQVMTLNGTVTSHYGAPADYAGWNSFVAEDPSGNSAWVGFTVGGNTDDRIYQVDYAAGTWTQKATLAGNFDMDFYGGNVFVSGLNSTNWSDPTSVWLLDTSGGNDHDLIIQMSGYSAGIAFDNSGNAFYASYDSVLYTWSGSAITGAFGEGYLTYANGTKLSDLETSAYDVDVDDAGNIIFNGNGAYSYTAVWNGTAGDGFNYDYLSIGSGLYGNWHTYIASTGNVLEDGTYYQADFYEFGIAQVVPEPATLLLLGLGAVLTAGRRKRS